MFSVLDSSPFVQLYLLRQKKSVGVIWQSIQKSFIKSLISSTNGAAVTLTYSENCFRSSNHPNMFGSNNINTLIHTIWYRFKMPEKDEITKGQRLTDRPIDQPIGLQADKKVKYRRSINYTAVKKVFWLLTVSFILLYPLFWISSSSLVNGNEEISSTCRFSFSSQHLAM